MIHYTTYEAELVKLDLAKPPKPFVSDGCSGFLSFFWRFAFGVPPPWEGHCYVHDQAYHLGGPNRLRYLADRRLMEGVWKDGHPVWAVILFIAVRIGGMWWLPYPSVRLINGHWKWFWDGVRWDYGYTYRQSVRRFWTGNFSERLT